MDGFYFNFFFCFLIFSTDEYWTWYGALRQQMTYLHNLTWFKAATLVVGQRSTGRSSRWLASSWPSSTMTSCPITSSSVMEKTRAVTSLMCVLFSSPNITQKYYQTNSVIAVGNLTENVCTNINMLLNELFNSFGIMALYKFRTIIINIIMTFFTYFHSRNTEVQWTWERQTRTCQSHRNVTCFYFGVRVP